MNAVTQVEFARMLGVSKQMVGKHKSHGRLVMTPDGLVDVDASQALIKKTEHPGYKHKLTAARRQIVMMPPVDPQEPAEPAAAANGVTYFEARARNELAKAEMAEMERDKLRSMLVDADEARRFAADLGATFRNSLEILPDRISAELVPLSDIESVRALLVENFEQILHDIARKIDKGFA